MTALILTKEERDRFAAYLEQDAATTDGLIEQMKKMNIPDVATRKLAAEAAACKIVAAKLRSTESA